MDARRASPDSLVSWGGSSLGLLPPPSAAPLAAGGIAIVQNKRYPARCQETTVSGLTRISASDQLVQIRRTTTQNRRSNRFSLGGGYLNPFYPCRSVRTCASGTFGFTDHTACRTSFKKLSDPA